VKERDRRDVIAMLRKLPAVTNLREMQAFLGMTHGYAKNAASRWMARELLAPFGPRTGTYYNLVVDPTGPQTRVKEAVDKLFNRPVVGIGAFALKDWTSQITHLRELAIFMGGPDRTLPQMNGIIAVGRKVKWFQVVLPKCEIGTDGFLMAPPEYALVDAIMADGAGDIWRPDPSDIDLPIDLSPEEASRRIEVAAEALGADIDAVREFAREIDGLDNITPGP